ncbi:MAG: rhomboid family intramembrane serine protease, partial [Blastocatellia bacterium]
MFGKTKKLVMCQACRGLIDSSMRICPLCGRDSVPDAPVRLQTADEHSQFFTKLVLGINVVVFLIMTAVATSGGNTRAFFSGVSGPQLVDFGGKFFPLIRQGQVWRLVSANFLHIGIMHLGFNCFALYQIGPLVEEAYGSQKFIFIYLVTGVLGFTLSSFYDPSTPSAGASASLMGLIGVTAVYGHRIGGTGGRALMRQMLMWAAITLGIGLFGLLSMDNSAHVGGLAGGAVLGFLMKPEQPSTAGSASLWNVVS